MLSRSRPLPFTCTGRESKPFRWLQGTTARVAIYPQMQLCVTKLDPVTLNADLERSFSSKGLRLPPFVGCIKLDELALCFGLPKACAACKP